MLILGKCLDPSLATRKHSVAVGPALFRTERRPGSGFGPALCPRWECALLLSLCVGRVLRPGGHLPWPGAEPQLCLSY